MLHTKSKYYQYALIHKLMFVLLGTMLLSFSYRMVNKMDEVPVILTLPETNGRSQTANK